MNTGDENLVSYTDASGTSSASIEVACEVGTASSGPELGTDIYTATTAPMQGSSASADGANVFTLSCLQKMAGVQDSCVSHLCSLTERCKQWEQRALYAESEVKSAEDVIKTMAEQYVEMEANYVSASDSDGFDDCGLSPDVMAIRDPNYRGGSYTPRGSRGRGLRARSNGRASGTYRQRRDSRYDTGDNYSGALLERGKHQCHRCKLYGHSMQECREKPAGYLALLQPFATGTAETVAVVGTPVAIKGSNRNKNKNKSETVTGASVEGKTAEQLN